MELFNTAPENLLNDNSTALYYGKILSEEECAYFFKTLVEEISWKNDEAVIFGKHFITKRKFAWYADKNYPYSYSNKTRDALKWTETLLLLKKKCEDVSGLHFNSCLLNLYHEGNEGMGWHSDDEKTLVAGAGIASLSVGAVRKFSFRNKQTRETVSIMLEPGSLLVMKDETQEKWQHSLLKTARLTGARVNLTFRTMAEIPGI